MNTQTLIGLSSILAGVYASAWLLIYMQQREDRIVRRHHTVVTKRADGTPNVYSGITGRTMREIDAQCQQEVDRFPHTSKIQEN